MDAAVEVRGLRHDLTPERRHRLLRPGVPIRAVDDVSFTIGAGEAVGLLGAKGAGKTTVLELLTGLLTPSQGTVRTCGLIPSEAADELGGRIGAVFGHRSHLWPDLSLAQSLPILASIHDLPTREWTLRRSELVERLALAVFLDVPVRQLSPGRRRRAEVAAALLHEPGLVVLDQPTLGLDVVSKQLLRSFFRTEQRVHGRTVLITSADLGDVQQCCDRLLVIDRGRLAYDGDVAGLVQRAAVHQVLVVDLVEPDRLLDDVPGTSLLAVEAGGLRQRLSFTSGGVSAALVLTEVAARAEVRDLTLEDPPLEDVVRGLSLDGT